MADHSLITPLPIDVSSLDPDDYTASLTHAAIKSGLLGGQALQTMQDQLFGILHDQIEQATHGESTSVPEESAAQLMDGIGYCIDIALKNCSSPEDSLSLLKNQAMGELYQMGAAILSDHARACERLLSRVRATRTKTVNEGYNILLDSTLPQYVHDWKAARFPRNFIVMTEYPLADERASGGIIGVRDRLEQLALENRFCGRFMGDLEGLLCDWSYQNRTTPKDAYVNLFTLAFQNAVFCHILGKTGVELSEADANLLTRRLTALDAQGRGKLIAGTVQSLLVQWAFDNERLNSYLWQACARLSNGLNAAGGSPAAFLAVQPQSPRFCYQGGERLSDDAFAAVVSEVLLCDDADERVKIIRTELRSLDDLCDLLAADCIFEEEFLSVYASFDDFTCALLLTRIPTVWEDENRMRVQNVYDWQKQFSIFFNALQPDARRGLRALSESLYN